jgi:hypothetical protein
LFLNFGGNSKFNPTFYLPIQHGWSFKLNVINIFWPAAARDPSKATAVAATAAETRANSVTAVVATGNNSGSDNNSCDKSR